LVIDAPTTFEFILSSDDGARLLLDGARVVDNWGSHRVRPARGRRELAPGVYHLRVRYYDHQGPAAVRLEASIDGAGVAPLPAALLRDPGPAYDLSDPCAGLPARVNLGAGAELGAERDERS
jgi:hypothetical protein